MGAYTFIRSLYNGGDSRFDTIRCDRKLFFAVFLMQGVWVTVCCLPVVALNSVPAEAFAGLSWDGWPSHVEILGFYLFRTFWFWLGMWSFVRGFAIECLADWQLAKWSWERKQKKHSEVFCRRGFWNRWLVRLRYLIRVEANGRLLL